MKAEMMKLSKIKGNEKNPRVVKDQKFKSLVESIQKFPEMLKLRPIVVNEDMVILGGNQRWKACQEAGLKEVPVLIANGLSKDQQDEFVIKDNVSSGEWDWKLINGEWDTDLLTDWGVDVIKFGNLDMLETVNKGEETDEWVGMPEFEAKDPTFKIVVHFENEKDREEFAEKYDMKFTKKEQKAWSTQYPYTGRDDLKSLKYE